MVAAAMRRSRGELEIVLPRDKTTGRITFTLPVRNGKGEAVDMEVDVGEHRRQGLVTVRGAPPVLAGAAAVPTYK